MELTRQADNGQCREQGLNPETLWHAKQLYIMKSSADIATDLCQIFWCFKHKETGNCQQGEEFDKRLKCHGQHQAAMLFSIGNLPGTKHHRQYCQNPSQKQYAIGRAGYTCGRFQNDGGT